MSRPSNVVFEKFRYVNSISDHKCKFRTHKKTAFVRHNLLNLEKTITLEILQDCFQSEREQTFCEPLGSFIYHITFSIDKFSLNSN